MGTWLGLNAILHCRVVFNSVQLMGSAKRSKKGGGRSRGRKKQELLTEPLVSTKMFV